MFKSFTASKVLVSDANGIQSESTVTASELLTLNTAPASAQSSPANPATTVSAVGVMMGLAGSITPTKSGRIMLVISGDVDNLTGDNGCVVQMRTGTGVAPVNGVALTGTLRGGVITTNVVASLGTATNRIPFSLNAVVTGLLVGTTYWIDIGLGTTGGGTARARNISVSAIEF